MSRILLCVSFVMFALAITPAFAFVDIEAGQVSYDNVGYYEDGNYFGEVIYTTDQEPITVSGTISNWHGDVNSAWEGLWCSVGLTPTHFFYMDGTDVTGYAHYGDTSYGDLAHQIGFAASNLVFYEKDNQMVSQFDDYAVSSTTPVSTLPAGTQFNFEMTYDFQEQTLSGSFGGSEVATRDISGVLAESDSFIFQIFVANSDSSDLTMGCDIMYETYYKKLIVPGDANRDGQVDGSDVTILAGNWQMGVENGLIPSWEDGDFNGDGKVDGSDVTILAGNWQYGVEAAASAVPEPSTFVLLLATMASLFVMRRR